MAAVNGADTYEVDEIVGRRRTKDGREDFLVRWQDYPPFSTTWEPIQNFTNCQEAIQEYFSKHWPIPGLKAKTVVHLSQQQQYPKKELITLKALPANKRNKILRGVREDLKKEILRHHQERNFCPGSTDYKGSSSLKGSIMGKSNQIFNYDRGLRNRKILSKNQKYSEEYTGTPKGLKSTTMGKTGRSNGEVLIADRKHYVSALASNENGEDSGITMNTVLKSQSRGRPTRNKKQLRTTDSLPGHDDVEQQDKLLVNVKMEYEEKQENKKTQRISKVRRRKKKRLNGLTHSSQKNRIIIDNQELLLPSRLTRGTLPNYSSNCVLDEELVVTNKDGCLFIKICNESKKNVINRQICEDLISAFHDAGKDDVSCVVISCAGGTFTYGWDLDQFRNISHAERRELLQKYRLLTRLLVTCPKPLIAAVNGPTAGFGLSLIALCDVVFASEKATFQTKFVEWGHPPVGCCSLTLPHLFGHSQAMSVILCNTKLDCDMAKERGIVTEILSFKDFEEELNSRLARFSLVSRQCLRDTKTLMVSGNIQELEDKNHEECDLFQKYISNDDILDGIVRRWLTSLQE